MPVPISGGQDYLVQDMRIPRHHAAGAERHARAEPTAGLVDLSILVVEADRDTRVALNTYFRILGCTVSVAGNTAEAVSAMQEQRFDLIIAEYRLPDGNGMHVLQSSVACQARALRFLTTAYSCDEFPIKEGFTGIDEVVFKPFSGDELRILIGRHVGRQTREGTARTAASCLPPTGRTEQC